jgi:hypothetical protein
VGFTGSLLADKGSVHAPGTTASFNKGFLQVWVPQDPYWPTKDLCTRRHHSLIQQKIPAGALSRSWGCDESTPLTEISYCKLFRDQQPHR